MLKKLISGSAVLLIALAALGAYLWQGAGEPLRIGLMPFTASNLQVVEGFKAMLAERGFREGHNVEYRSLPADGNIDAQEKRTTELLAWKPRLILSVSTPTSRAAYRATKSSATPLVFAQVTDPLQAGIIKNPMHPGEHATGVRLPSSSAMRLQWLLRVAPGVRKVYVPYSGNDSSSTTSLQEIEQAAKLLGISLLPVQVANDEEIMRAAKVFPKGTDAILIPNDSRIGTRIDLFIATALERGIPLSGTTATHVERGALMTYGLENLSIGRQAGRLALEIINGRLPGDLPVETAESALYINQTTAQSIGLKIDDAVLRQARKIIH
jgi:putative ABC transport system substrate-binding protein